MNKELKLKMLQWFFWDYLYMKYKSKFLVFKGDPLTFEECFDSYEYGSFKKVNPIPCEFMEALYKEFKDDETNT